MRRTLNADARWRRSRPRLARSRTSQWKVGSPTVYSCSGADPRRRTMATAETVLRPDHAGPRKHFIFTDEHDQLRESIGSFVTRELAPHAAEWEETTFPD